MHIVDASAPPNPGQSVIWSLPEPTIALLSDPNGLSSEYWLNAATFTLTEADVTDPRCVHVDSIDDELAAIKAVSDSSPIATAIAVDVLKAAGGNRGVRRALVAESLAYSTLQAGPEFGRWLAARGVRSHASDVAAPITYDRDGDHFRITLNRPHRHNAFTDDMRALMLEALTVVALDPSITAVEIAGNGPSFCSGGDLVEFGEFVDPASAHLARTRHSPALALELVRQRLGNKLHATVHGEVLGSGLEMAAFCGRVSADGNALFGLPELRIGLIPGAGGTFSIPRRIGRWRTAYLLLSGRKIDASRALEWHLIDAVRPT